MIKKILAISAATFALGLPFSAHAQDINFGIISTESTQNLKQDWEPLIKDMEKQTGMKVKIRSLCHSLEKSP